MNIKQINERLDKLLEADGSVGDLGVSPSPVAGLVKPPMSDAMYAGLKKQAGSYKPFRKYQQGDGGYVMDKFGQLICWFDKDTIDKLGIPEKE